MRFRTLYSEDNIGLCQAHYMRGYPVGFSEPHPPLNIVGGGEVIAISPKKIDGIDCVVDHY
jgi:hypothetical protein